MSNANVREEPVRSEELVLIIGLASIMGGVAVIWMAMQSRRQFREMEHRERLAMIERGVVPAPESDPVAFERAIGLQSGAAMMSTAGSRSRSVGVILVGMGIGLAFLIALAAGEPETGIGIGGAFAILGCAFFVNSMLSSGRRGYVPPSYTPPYNSPYHPPRPPIRSDQPPPQ
jgi:hypothetical protein